MYLSVTRSESPGRPHFCPTWLQSQFSQPLTPGLIIFWDGSQPMEFGMHHPLGMWMHSPTWKLSQSHTLGIFMEASSGRHDQLLAQLPALFPS